MWTYQEMKITKEDYESIMNGEKKPSDFFTVAQLAGYGAIPGSPVEKDGEYYIPYGISTSCD